MELAEKAAYLKGLIEGLGVDESTKEGRIIKAMSELLCELASSVREIDADMTQAYDQLNDISAELEDLEADLYEELEDDDSEDEDDELPMDTDGHDPYYEVACPNCGETVYVSEGDLDAGEAICTSCGVTFEVALADDEADEDPEDAPVKYEVTCPNCGRECGPDDTFCSSCGAQL